MICITWPFLVFFQFAFGWFLLVCFLNLILFLRRGKPPKEMKGIPHSEPAVLEGWSWLRGAQWRAVCCCAAALPAPGKMKISAHAWSYPQQACISHKSSSICLVTEDYLSFVLQWLLKKHLSSEASLCHTIASKALLCRMFNLAVGSQGNFLSLHRFSFGLFYHKSVGEEKVPKKKNGLFGSNNLSIARM